MTIADKFNQILNIKKEMKEALINKGSDINDDTILADYPQKIKELKSGENNVIYNKDYFYNTRTVDSADYQSLFKGCKEKWLDLTFMGKEFDGDLTDIFKDCINLETLNLTKWIIPSSNNSGSMFDNVPNLKKVIMNYSDYESISLILNDLPDHSGAVEGDYIFEVSYPLSVVNKIEEYYGTMYRGWTIVKDDQDYLIKVSRATNNSNKCISAGLLDNNVQNSSIFINNEITYGESYGEYIETAHLNQKYLLPNFVNLTLSRPVKILEANDVLNKFNYVNLDIQIDKTYAIEDIIGNYDCKTLNELKITNIKNNNNERIFSLSNLEDKLSTLTNLSVDYTITTSGTIGNTDKFIMNDMTLDSLYMIDISRIHEVTLKNLDMPSLVYMLGFNNNNGVSKVTIDNVYASKLQLSNMFYYNKLLTEVDLSGLHLTTERLKCDHMCTNCENLTKLNLSNIRPSSVFDSDIYVYSYSVYGCKNLRTIIMANCTEVFIEYIMTGTNGLPADGTLYSDTDMSHVLPFGWTWKPSSEYTG